MVRERVGDWRLAWRFALAGLIAGMLVTAFGYLGVIGRSFDAAQDQLFPDRPSISGRWPPALSVDRQTDRGTNDPAVRLAPRRISCSPLRRALHGYRWWPSSRDRRTISVRTLGSTHITPR